MGQRPISYAFLVRSQWMSPKQPVSIMLGRENPKVALLSNGEEPGKGNHAVKEAFELLQQSSLNFVGNIEGRDLFAGNVDVVVCDGFVGNVVVKQAEGLATSLGRLLKGEMRRGFFGKIGTMEELLIADPEVGRAICLEIERQVGKLEMIASENFVSTAVRQAQGSVLTHKYAEGYPGKRYYGGCEYVDLVEELARNRVKTLFGAEYANVQPHSGSQANMTPPVAAGADSGLIPTEPGHNGPHPPGFQAGRP